MKTPAILTKALATTILLTCAAGTPTQAVEVSNKAEFTDYQLKNLIVFLRPNIAVASPAVVARALQIAPLKEAYIPPCTTTPNVTRVVKLRINNNFNVKDTGRDVISKKIIGGDARAVPEPVKNLESTTYDLKLNKTVWPNSGPGYMAITIILKDRDLIFLGDKYSVTTVEATDSIFYCLDPIKNLEDKKDDEKEDESDTGKDKWHQATFYVDETKIGTQKFNIRIIVLQKHDYILPIIIDPVVENNGFN